MIKQITKSIIQFSFKAFGSNCYLLNYDNKKIMIDNGSQRTRKELQEDFNKIKMSFNDINIALLTHLHWDHCGNMLLFKKAKTYASKAEIKDFKENPTMIYTTPSKRTKLTDELNKIHFYPLSELPIKDLEVIEVPGHTRGSVAFYLRKQKVLFSGDTIFDKDAYAIGRTDLPTSVPDQMEGSIKKLLSLDFKILCPGH